MNNLRLSFSGADLSQLRVLVDAVGKDIAMVTAGTAPADPTASQRTLDVSWLRLVEMLDLGREPDVRSCPSCNGLCMVGATRCGHCWAPLPALVPKTA